MDNNANVALCISNAITKDAEEQPLSGINRLFKDFCKSRLACIVIKKFNCTQ